MHTAGLCACNITARSYYVVLTFPPPSACLLSNIIWRFKLRNIHRVTSARYRLTLCSLCHSITDSKLDNFNSLKCIMQVPFVKVSLFVINYKYSILSIVYNVLMLFVSDIACVFTIVNFQHSDGGEWESGICSTVTRLTTILYARLDDREI